MSWRGGYRKIMHFWQRVDLAVLEHVEARLSLYEDCEVLHWVGLGVEHGFAPCCIEFYVRSRVLGVLPLEAGGVVDPIEDGYVRCPSCAERL